MTGGLSSSRRAYKAKRKKGLCAKCCNPATFAYCLGCLAKRRRQSKLSRMARRKLGICYHCECKAVKGGYCEKHRTSRLTSRNAIRAERIRLGLCANCGRVTGGYSECLGCRKKRNERKTAGRRKQREKVSRHLANRGFHDSDNRGNAPDTAGTDTRVCVSG